MKKIFFVIIITPMIISFSSTSFAGNFSQEDIKHIKDSVFYITKMYSNWGKTINVVDIDIVKKYQTTGRHIRKILQKGITGNNGWIIGIRNNINRHIDEKDYVGMHLTPVTTRCSVPAYGGRLPTYVDGT